MINQLSSKSKACRYISNVHFIVQRRCFAQRNLFDWINSKHRDSYRVCLLLPSARHTQQRWRHASTLQCCVVERHTAFQSPSCLTGNRRFLGTSGGDDNNRTIQNSKEGSSTTTISTTIHVNNRNTNSSHNTPNKIPVKENTKIASTTDTITTTTMTNDPYWMECFVPIAYRPYAYLARLDKPIGTMLLVRTDDFIFVCLD